VPPSGIQTRSSPRAGFCAGRGGGEGLLASILDSTGCLSTTTRNGMGKKAKPPKIEGVAGSLRVYYPDERIAPRLCNRTAMRRDFCPCLPCRKLRRRKHRAHCRCRMCFSDRIGEFVDYLGRRTSGRRWLWFLTLTFRTQDFPWARGFPMEQSQPFPDFVQHFFRRMISWIEREVHGPVEFFVVHQFGEIGGRLHLHCGLSWPGLFEYRWKDLQEILWTGAGLNRIVPWTTDAGFYIGRYIGRDAWRCHWDFRVGPDRGSVQPVSVGRRVLVESRAPYNSSRAYRQTFGRWHR
jgi:hypothetical protein